MRMECREPCKGYFLLVLLLAIVIVSHPDMHHGTCVTHVPWCIPGSLTISFLWSRWRGKRSRHSRCMRNPQFTYMVRGPWGSLFRIICVLVQDGCQVMLVTQRNNLLAIESGHGVLLSASSRGKLLGVTRIVGSQLLILNKCHFIFLVIVFQFRRWALVEKCLW